MAIEYLSPTDENIKNSLLKNTLDRNSHVFTFCKLLSSYNDATSIALDGTWGSGKTFFVKQCKLVLDALNPQSSMNMSDRDSICTILEKSQSLNSLKNLSNYTVYYDAWEHDDNTDPLLSLLYCIAVETKTTDAFVPLPNCKKTILNVIDTLSKNRISPFLEVSTEDNPLSGIKSHESLKELIRNYLNTLPHERGNRVNVIIDEMDRCTPSFAIKLLERIKHYINNERITFVFATNLHSLEKTVRHYYGDNIDGTKYLDRFFDIRFLLPPINEDLLRHGIDFGNVSVGSTVCRYIAKRFNFSFRETLRYARSYRYASNTINSEHATICWVKYLLPIALALELSDIDKFRAFMAGEKNEELGVILEVPKISEWLLLDFKEIVCSEEKIPNKEADKSRTLLKILEEFYEAIFKNDFTQDRCVYVGRQLEVSIWTKQFAFLSVGLFL